MLKLVSALYSVLSSSVRAKKKRTSFYNFSKQILQHAISITSEDTRSIKTSRKVVELEMFEYKVREENTEREISS